MNRLANYADSFGASVRFWLNLQASCELAVAQIAPAAWGTPLPEGEGQG